MHKLVNLCEYTALALGNTHNFTPEYTALTLGNPQDSLGGIN